MSLHKKKKPLKFNIHVCEKVKSTGERCPREGLVLAFSLKHAIEKENRKCPIFIASTSFNDFKTKLCGDNPQYQVIKDM